MHTIALRHYSFPHLATSSEPSKYVKISWTTLHDTSGIGTADWRRHDPSSISLLFRYLHYEEWRNGILMYRRLIIIILSVLPIAACTGVPYALYRGSDDSKWRRVFVVVLLAPILFVFATGAVILVLHQVVAGFTSLKIRRETDGIMRALGEFISRYPFSVDLQSKDRDFTTPAQAARGDYVPLPIPLVKVRNEVRNEVVRGDRVDTYHMEVAHGPRALPTLWENVSILS
jgi:hypothetical protein